MEASRNGESLENTLVVLGKLELIKMLGLTVHGSARKWRKSRKHISSVGKIRVD